MLRLLVRKEFLDSLLNQRFVVMAVFSLILMPLSATINYSYYDARKTSFDSQFAAFHAEDDDDRAMRAYRPPALLSTVSRGNEPYMPLYFEFSSTSTGQFADDTLPGNIEAEDFSMLSSFGTFDLLFLVQVVYSLLAVLLAFDMVAGEKERGTLKAMLANRVPRDNIILAKMLGGFGVLWLTFFAGFLLLFLVLVSFNPQVLQPPILGRLFFIFFTSTLFLAGFFSLGLAVSTFCHSSRTAIVVLLVVWVVLQLVIPRAGEMLASVVQPVRSEHEVRAEREQIIVEELARLTDEAGELFTEVTGSTSAEYAFRSLRSDEPWVPTYKSRYQALFRDIKQQQNDRLRAVSQAWERQRQQQKSLGNTIALLSPASALSFLVSDAASTGDLAYDRYRSAVAEQHQIVDREFFSKVESNSYRIGLSGVMLSGNFEDEAPSPDQVPPFTVTDPTISDVAAGHTWAIVTLLFYLVVPFAVAYVRFLKYDPR